MTMTDPLADMLTRIRNANTAMHDDVRMPASKLKESLAVVLQKEGYIDRFEILDNSDRPGRTLKIDMKYSPSRARVISGLKRVSKPGLRVYSKADEIPRVLGGLGCRGRLDQPRPHERQRSSQAPYGRRDPLLRLVGDYMSRIGKTPIPVPEASTSPSTARPSRSKGPRAPSATSCPSRSPSARRRALVLRRVDDERESKALHGSSARSSTTWSSA